MPIDDYMMGSGNLPILIESKEERESVGPNPKVTILEPGTDYEKRLLTSE